MRPHSFRANEETLSTNFFQTDISNLEQTLRLAEKEWEKFIQTIKDAEIPIMTFEQTGVDIPDALFLNNWFISLPNKKIFLCPMLAKNRRKEHRLDIIQQLSPDSEIIDMRKFTDESSFLEGTGSLVFDHDQKIAFASLSPRTTEKPLLFFEKISGYKVVSFKAMDHKKNLIYHTNVMMAISQEAAILCSESIESKSDLEKIKSILSASKKIIVEISSEQLFSFAGNMLQVKNKKSQNIWIASDRALKSLLPAQLEILKDNSQIISSDLNTIESVGGGSARCLLAEIF